MSGKINGILFGYGSIGRRHAKVLHEVTSELAIVDTKSEARDRAANDHPSARVFDSLKSFCDSGWESTSAVATIATWGPSHAELFHALVDRGVRRIFCEKPLAVSVEAAETMVLRAKQEGVSFAVHHFMRYGGLPEALRRFSSEHGLGEPVSLVVEGGAAGIVTNGIHWIDLASGLFGSQPRWVVSTAFGEPINPRSPNVQLFGGSAAWVFEDGREAVVTFNNQSSVCMVGRVFYRSAVIEIDAELNVIARRRDMSSVEQFPAVTRTGPLAEDLFRGQLPGVVSLADGMQVALSEILDGRSVTVSGSDGGAAVSSCIGALLAAREKRVVDLPMDPDSPEGRESWPIS